MTDLEGLNLKLGRRVDQGGLDPIPRSLGRQRFAERDGDRLPFYGYDLWNAWEVGFLLPSGKPVVYHMQATYDAHSPFMVESKSFKLFLNGCNNRVFDGLAAFSDDVRKALSSCLEADVTLAFYAPDEEPGRCRLSGQALDDLEPSAIVTDYDPNLLGSEPCSNGSFAFYSHLLRSNCPVTNQPDWGSIRISGRGALQPVAASLLAYLISFRNHQDFHEACCETVFLDLYERLTPDFLEVSCHYTRRGGLDINPLRTTRADRSETAMFKETVWRQ